MAVNLKLLLTSIISFSFTKSIFFSPNKSHPSSTAMLRRAGAQEVFIIAKIIMAGSIFLINAYNFISLTLFQNYLKLFITGFNFCGRIFKRCIKDIRFSFRNSHKDRVKSAYDN